MFPGETNGVRSQRGLPGRFPRGNGDIRNPHAGETHYVPWCKEDFRKKPVSVVHMEDDSALGHTTPDGKPVEGVEVTEPENLA